MKTLNTQQIAEIVFTRMFWANFDEEECKYIIEQTIIELLEKVAK